MKNRNVILFGAGAAIDWNAPSTNKLTEVVKEAGFWARGNNIKVTGFIYDTLVSEGYPQSLLNFETIINVIEELIVHYSSFDSNKKIKSISSVFFNSKFEDSILNYSLVNGTKHGFKLDIPGVNPNFAKSAYNNETPEQFFLQQLLSEIITDIAIFISKYAYDTDQKSDILTDENSVINVLFCDWIDRINFDGILRMYSLNYDRNPKIILESCSIYNDIFEGFKIEKKRHDQYDRMAEVDVLRILTDTESNTHYNLHGSAYWKVEARDNSGLMSPTYFLTDHPVLDTNYEDAVWQTERGKTVILSNIITGYQKTQKAIFPPFKQMQAAFDRDCCDADTLYIIGYSFNDEHINASIRLCLQYNPQVKIVIIDPSFNKNNFDVEVAIKVFSKLGESVKARTLDTNLHSFYDGKIIAHTITFKEYLSQHS